jgi:hypothetical protein
MFKQAILAATAAGMIATAGLAVTSTAASASPYQSQNQNWNGPYPHALQPFCRPVFKQVKWWDRFGYPHWKQVIVAPASAARTPQPPASGLVIRSK